MHVALVSTTFVGPKPGKNAGIERLAKELTGRLTNRGIDVTVVTTFWNGGLPSEYFGTARVIRIQDTSSFLGRWAGLGDSHYWSWGFGVARVLHDQVRPDVVYTLAPLASTPALVKANLPVVTTFHHPEEISRLKDLLHKPFHRILESRAYPASTLVITPSHFSASAVEQMYGMSGERIRIVPWGVDPTRFKPGATHSSRETRLLYVGHHEPRKGLTYLLEAIALLYLEGVPVRLTTVGGGPQIPELRRLVRELHISDFVTFLGYLPDPEDEKLPALYSQADVFVLPSLNEGFGFVLVEAMASGLPVVASNASAIPEVVGDAGLLFPPGNPVALAEIIKGLAEDPPRGMELAKRGRERVEALFTWDKVVPQIVSVCEEAIDIAGSES